MINEVISKIESMQTGPGSVYGAGLFLCSRENKNWGYARPDNNIFGTASVVFILKEIKTLLTLSQQDKVDEIARKAEEAYPRYKNKDGLETYNFWETRPSNHFPFGHVFRRLDHFRLPDDIDDTALIYLNLNHGMEQNEWLKAKLKMHAGENGIYSTWFGKNMPHEQDICALSNLMYWIYINRLQQDEMDYATLMWMKEAVLSGDFARQPFKTARHYATVPLIIYHLSRLLFKFEIEALEPVRPHLVQKAEMLFEKEKPGLNKILLSTSLWKLGVREPRHQVDIAAVPDKAPGFYSFIGALLGPYAHPLLKSMAGSEMTRINWKCGAHELALCLENIVLRNG